MHKYKAPGTKPKPRSQLSRVGYQTLHQRSGSREWDTVGKTDRGLESTLCLTFVFAEVLHFLLDAVTPVGDVHMESVITAALPISPLTPLFVGLGQARLRFGYHVVN